MRRLRTFIAVELGTRAVTRAQQLIRRFQEAGVEANWVPPEQMHLTLKFLGEILESEVVDVCRVVAKAAMEVEPFEMTVRGAGAFPSAENPKTLWLGIEDGAEELVALQQHVEQALHKDLRFPRERRQFVPHLTIGRVKRTENADALMEILAAAADFEADLTVVEEVTTFSSFLTRNGPIYEALAHAPLGSSVEEERPRGTKKIEEIEAAESPFDFGIDGLDDIDDADLDRLL